MRIDKVINNKVINNKVADNKVSNLSLVVDKQSRDKPNESGSLNEFRETIKDILEEIIGDFTTQSPSRASGYRKEVDGSWLVDGSSSLRELNKKLNLNLPLEGPRTLNGLVLEHFEDIPEPNTSFRINGHTLEIIQTHDRIVKSVKIFP